MADVLDIACPHCSAKLRVPPTLVGKKVRCKQCQKPFVISDPSIAKAPEAPVAAPKKDNSHLSPAQQKYAEEEADDDGKKDYGVTYDSNAPRCPHCAKELDPPDARICINCGYDTQKRVRNESRKVYDPTTGDWMSNLGPGIGMLLLTIAILTGVTICWMNMNDWLEGTIIETDEKSNVTGKKIYIVQPWCFSLWISVMGLFVAFKCGKFAFKRLVYNYRPPEKIKKK